MKRPLLKDYLLKNVFFDTCVYHLPGIELLLKVIPIDNILFGSEMVGAVRGIDPQTGQYYDDTKRYLDALRSERRRSLQDIRRQCAQGVSAAGRRIDRRGAPSEALAPAEAPVDDLAADHGRDDAGLADGLERGAEKISCDKTARSASLPTSSVPTLIVGKGGIRRALGIGAHGVGHGDPLLRDVDRAGHAAPP